MSFTSLNTRRVNFSFVQPRTGQEIFNEIKSLQEQQRKSQEEWKIIDDTKEVKKKEAAATNRTEVSIEPKDKKVQSTVISASSFIQKENESLDKIFGQPNGRVYTVPENVSDKDFIKKVLSTCKDVNEKKKIVSEDVRIKLESAKKRKKTVTLVIDNSQKFFKFL